MAAMYILGNPDHYTDHKFHTFYWKSYVHEARSPLQMHTEYQNSDKVAKEEALWQSHQLRITPFTSRV